MRHIKLAATLAALTVAGCGGAAPHPSGAAQPATTQGCNLPSGAGVMGACVPHRPVRPAAPLLAGRTLIPDVSEFQSCALHSEAIFRVYEAGTDRQDTTAACHARELARLHAWAGVYAFLRRSRDCTYEAARVLGIVRVLPVHVQVIIGDAETGIREGKVACFLHAIERGGYPAVEYTCPGCGDEQSGRVWIAAYPYRPAGVWVAHQFSDNWPCRGVTGDCSIDEGLLAIRRGPAPKPGPTPAQRHQLYAAYRLRAELRRDLAKHGGSKGPAAPRSYRGVWKHWKQEGDQTNALIRRLHAEGV